MKSSIIILILLACSGCSFLESTTGNLFSAANEAGNTLDGISKDGSEARSYPSQTSSSLLDDLGYGVGVVVGSVVAVGAATLIALGKAQQQQPAANTFTPYRPAPTCTSVEIIKGYWQHQCY